MPIVQISMIQGRSKEKKQELIGKMIDTFVEVLQVRKDHVHIIIHEVPQENTTKDWTAKEL